VRSPPRVAILPDGSPAWLGDAVRAGSGEVVPIEQADALLWDAGDPSDLASVLARASQLRWVQLSWTGVDRYLELMRDGRTWTCARDVFGEGVAEHALALTLAAFRDLPRLARSRTWSRSEPRTLFEAKVVVVGSGAIGRGIADLLAPFRCKVSFISRRNRGDLLDAVRGAEVVYLAVPLTRETDAMIGEPELLAMGSRAWLVNVARGRLVDTDALVHALREAWIAGAALDVTEPEPLPEGHPLWSLPNCLITPHMASVDELARAPYSRLVSENVRRFARGEELLGIVDPQRGY
jgi:phosphoglycerate dehydrogenase-like enzyme